MEILDNFGKLQEIDKSGMLSIVEAFPQQCRDAVALAEDAEMNETFRDVSSLAVLGMGGSGIGGDLLQAVVESESDLPVSVVKGYDLPRHVDSSTLVFAVSYSGGTEETLTTFRQALERGAKIVAITSGGRLYEQARESKLPMISIPAGFQPRAALGFLFLPMLVMLSRWGLLSPQQDAMAETLAILDSLRERFLPQKPFSSNSAKQLAQELQGKIPVVYGSQGLTAPVALRWKCQFNENSKTQALWNFFPELNHNEIVGWEHPGDLLKNFVLVFLRDKGDHLRVVRRMEITKELIAEHVGGIHEVWCEGESKLAKVLGAIYEGDFVSVYLALLNGVDPTPVERIAVLKERMAES